MVHLRNVTLSSTNLHKRVCKVFVEIRTTPIVGAGLRECQKAFGPLIWCLPVAWHVLRSGGAQGPRPTVGNAA